MSQAQSQPGHRPPGHVTEAAAHGLVPAAPPSTEDGEVQPNSPVSRLPVEVGVTVPVRAFRVRDLLALEPGKLIESQWGNGEDLPLSSGDVQLAWSEFEVIDTQLAVRVTRLI